MTTSFPRFEGDAAGIFIMTLARGLAREGHTVSVVAPHYAGAPVHERRWGVDVHRFAYAWPHRLQKVAYDAGIPDNLRMSRLARLEVPAFLLSGTLRMLRVARKADMIHAFWTPCAVMAAPAAKLWGKPLAVTLVESGPSMVPGILYRTALRVADILSCNAVEITSRLETYGYHGDVIDIKHMPDMDRLAAEQALDGELAAWCNDADAVVTCVARLVPFKDPVGVVRAVPGVLARHPGARFLFVGDGPLEDEMTQRIDQLGIARAVRLAGNREDIGAILRASTVFVANSPITNCYSTSILEAMAVGVPVAITDVGDPSGSFTRKDYVEPVEPNNPADLARGINHLLDNEALRDQRRTMGRQFLDDYGFTPEAVVGRTLDMYRTVLRQKGKYAD